MSNTNSFATANANHDEDAAMNDALQGGSVSATGSSGAVDPPADRTRESTKPIEEEVDFESDDFAVPPSFGRELLEESLKNDAQPHVLWELLKSLPRRNQEMRPMPCSIGWPISSKRPRQKTSIFVSFHTT